ncbi:MAG: hypothetical protein ACPHA6_13225 [Paracoccaceae bacterium]
MIQTRQDRRRAEAGRNKTIDYLKQLGYEDLANAAATGAIDPSSAINQALSMKYKPAPASATVMTLQEMADKGIVPQSTIANVDPSMLSTPFSVTQDRGVVTGIEPFSLTGKGTQAAFKTDATSESFPNGFKMQQFQDGRTVYMVPGEDEAGNLTVERIEITQNSSPEDLAKVAQARRIAEEDQTRRTVQETRRVDNAEFIAKKFESAVDSLKSLNSQLVNLKTAKAALDAGADSGVLRQYMPSFEAATSQLRTAANNLGLDIVGSVTFGALSAGELNLALRTALDLSLPPPQLREVVDAKVAAIEKAQDELYKAARLMSNPDYTAEMYMRDYTQRGVRPTSTDTNRDIDALQQGLEKLETE